MNKRNYQKELNKLTENLQKENHIPTLLIHSCCAPCSSYVLEYLSQYFEITVFYYNPNIYPEQEYTRRVEEQRQLILNMNLDRKVAFVEGKYDTKRFYDSIKGMEKEPEGGLRCFACYELRLQEAATFAKEHGFEYFTTTLSISPLKNADKLNEIGERLAGEWGVTYLNSDFKKKNGYKRSIELSKEYDLYRQDYCGCVYSVRHSEDGKSEV